MNKESGNGNQLLSLDGDLKGQLSVFSDFWSSRKT